MRFYFIAGILSVSVVLSVPVYQDSAFSSEYISVQRYNEIHPEQTALGEKFSKIVKAKGMPIPKGVQKKPIKIAFIYPGEQASDYWHRSILSFKARMDEINILYDLKEYFSKPAVDYRIQEKQIKNTLDQKPDFLVFTLDIKRHKRIIERILTRQTPKIILQNITTPLRAWEGKQPFLYVGFDHAQGTKMIADYYIEKTSRAGNYALLYFSQGYVSSMRGDTFITYLKKHSHLQMLSSYYTDGNRDKAKRAALEIIDQTPDIKFFYACSTDVAMGGIDALTEANPPVPIMINGWGGGTNELEAIRNRKMDVTVMRMNDDNGVAMAEAIRYEIEGKTSKVPVVYSGSFALVEKGISQNRLEKLQQRAFRYSGIH